MTPEYPLRRVLLHFPTVATVGKCQVGVGSHGAPTVTRGGAQSASMTFSRLARTATTLVTLLVNGLAPPPTASVATSGSLVEQGRSPVSKPATSATVAALRPRLPGGGTKVFARERFLFA